MASAMTHKLPLTRSPEGRTVLVGNSVRPRYSGPNQDHLIPAPSLGTRRTPGGKEHGMANLVWKASPLLVLLAAGSPHRSLP